MKIFYTRIGHPTVRLAVQDDNTVLRSTVRDGKWSAWEPTPFNGRWIAGHPAFREHGPSVSPAFAEFIDETTNDPSMNRVAAAALCIVAAHAPKAIANDPGKLLSWLDRTLSDDALQG